jgi:hypothetical protein
LFFIFGWLVLVNHESAKKGSLARFLSISDGISQVLLLVLSRRIKNKHNIS